MVIPRPTAEEWEKRHQELLERRRQANQIVDADTYNKICATLFKYDPMGLNFDSNTDEYNVEADYIIIRFSEVKGIDELAAMIQEVFIQQFDEKMARDLRAFNTYHPIASEIWALMSEALIK